MTPFELNRSIQDATGDRALLQMILDLESSDDWFLLGEESEHMPERWSVTYCHSDTRLTVTFDWDGGLLNPQKMVARAEQIVWQSQQSQGYKREHEHDARNDLE